MWPWLPSKLLIPSGKQAGVNLWRSTLSSKKWKTSRRPLRELKIWRKKLDWQNFDQVSVELCRFLYCQRHCSPDGQVSHPLLLSSCEKFIDICSTKSYICKAPVRLRLLASVVQSKKNWQRFYVDDIFVFKQAVSCCHHPGAANLCHV